MSFISVEPQSKVLLKSHNNHLLAQFDTQLQIIADRYLAFFQERWSIEATYIDSLRKLHRKAKTVDASFDGDPRTEPTTTRRVWDKLRDNLGRNADARQSFMDILANDVIKPLEILKESNDEIRSWMKVNLNVSASCYADHAENTISRLQLAQLRKYQPQQHAYFASVSQHPQDVPNKRLGFGSRRSAPYHGLREDWQGPESASPSVSDDDRREAVTTLNRFRLLRADYLEEGYELLEELVFTPTIQDILLRYMDGMIKACAKHDDIAKSTGAEVENALGGIDTSDLKVSFRQALSFSTPPLILYRNYRPGGYSNLIFGVPLVGHGIVTEDKVPKVMRMCINEVEKRGLNIDKIYSSDSLTDAAVRKLLHRFESEKSFLFTSTDNIYSVATLLKRYLHDLPEPLLVLSLQEHKHYVQHRDKYTKDNFSLLRSKIRELHPIHWASLEALLRHLLNVAFHSGNSRRMVKKLSSQFCNCVLGYDVSSEDDNYLKTPVMEDLIRNAHTLFDECPSQSPPGPSSDVAEATSTHTYGSLFLSPELPRSADIQATGSTSRHRPGLVDGIHASTQSSFSSFPSDGAVVNRRTPPQTALLSPLRGGLSSKRPTEGVETTTQEARGTKAKSRPLPRSEAPTILQGPPESILSSTSGSPLSSATSLQTRMWSP